MNFLQLCAQELAPILGEFFTQSINIGAVPHNRKSANVVPLFRKRDHSLPSTVIVDPSQLPDYLQIIVDMNDATP